MSKKSDKGIFYTPPVLADLLAKPLVLKPGMSVFDPCCGEGALLEAISRRFQRRRKTVAPPKLTGCDIFAPRAVRKAQTWDFVRSCFFEYVPDKKYDLIVANPPYVSQGKLDEEFRSEIWQRHGRAAGLPRNANLWAYCLLKSCDHLAKGGSLACILPWAFLEADYSRALRKHLWGRFWGIRVLGLSREHFADTDTRVVLAWFDRHGRSTQSIQAAFAKSHDDKIEYTEISEDAWCGRSLFPSLDGNVAEVLAKLGRYDFRPLSDYATIHIGVVTGANDYFLMSPKQAKENGFGEPRTIPIVRFSRELSGLTQQSCGQVLIRTEGRLSDKAKAYVEHGETVGVHETSHSERRDPWHAVDCGEVPDAFFTYRVAANPFLVLNPRGYQCTNSLHRVYFTKKVTKAQRRWIQLSVLSIPGLLSLECLARHYGNGMLKMEPGALSESLVFAPKRNLPQRAYTGVSDLIAAGKRLDACIEATKLVIAASEIPKKLLQRCAAVMNDLRDRRGAAPAASPVSSISCQGTSGNTMSSGDTILNR